MGVTLMHHSKRVLLTGAAGFIGFHLADRLLETEKDITVLGVDSLNDYYDIELKNERLRILQEKHGSRFVFKKLNLADKPAVSELFISFAPETVINLAAQPGVRYSITHPDAYIESNIIGFYNILEACRHCCERQSGFRQLIFASSSSVYGLNSKIPYSTEDKTDSPVSLYAATKKSDELLAHAYAKLYSIPMTGLRFFTVYGPMGRPDMAYFSFTRKMIRGEKIQLFNNGDMYRDFTYVADIVEGILKVAASEPPVNQDGFRYRLYNIGGHHPEKLSDFVTILEECLLKEKLITKPAEKEYLPMQPGDVYQTCADMSPMQKDFNFTPKTELREGLEKFVSWYKGYYCNDDSTTISK